MRISVSLWAYLVPTVSIVTMIAVLIIPMSVTLAFLAALALIGAVIASSAR